MGKKSYICVGGYGIQHWTSNYKPDIEGKCNGLSICILDHETGRLSLHSTIEGISNPGTLVQSHNGKFIYCANEEHDFGGMGHGGGVTACAFDPKTGTGHVINQSLAYGSSSCYTFIDKTDKYLLVANHGTKFYVTRFYETEGGLEPVCVHDQGCVSLFAIRPDGGVGRLLDRHVLGGTGAHPLEHASAHPHCILIDDQDFVVIPNKGGDSITVAKLNRETEKLDILSVYHSDFGTSPRHAMFVPGTDYILGTNEFGGQVTSYKLDRETGDLKRVCILPTFDPSAQTEKNFIMKMANPWAIDIQIHPNRKFVYADNTDGLILQYALDLDTGMLTHVRNVRVVEQGMPRGLQISPDGDYLIATTVTGEKIAAYRIDQETGFLSESDALPLPTPTAVRFVGTVE